MGYEGQGCQWNGDCDHCGWAFCIATSKQCKEFYSREETETKRKWGNKIKEEKISEFWIRHEKSGKSSKKR